MIDMFDLPTDAELKQCMLEAQKKESKDADPFDNNTFFEFWTPVTKHQSHVVNDMTGAVKPKCDFTKTEVSMDKQWAEFLKSERAREKKNVKPVTKNDTFGSVVVDSYAQQPNPKNLVGSIKALKKTMIKEMSGRVHRKTEELGKDVIVKSMAASPSKSSLVGIVKPKKDGAWSNKSSLDSRLFTASKTPVQEAPVETKVYNSFGDKIKPSGKNFASYETKDSLPGIKAHGKTAGSKVGAVKSKPMSAVGSKVFKNIDGFAK